MKSIQSAPVRYLSDKDLAARYSVSRNTIWRWSREGKKAFPKPVTLNGSITRWRLIEIEAWEQAQEPAA